MTAPDSCFAARSPLLEWQRHVRRRHETVMRFFLSGTLTCAFRRRYLGASAAYLEGDRRVPLHVSPAYNKKQYWYGLQVNKHGREDFGFFWVLWSGRPPGLVVDLVREARGKVVCVGGIGSFKTQVAVWFYERSDTRFRLWSGRISRWRLELCLCCAG